MTELHPQSLAALILPSWRVLDVGSGDNPYPRADVLVDYLPKTLEAASGVTHENPTGTIVTLGKGFVVGSAHALPFKSNSFDFAIARHVLEHVDDPELACRELSRVARAGYLETPRSWFEHIDGSPFHKWLVDIEDGVLHFRRKTSGLDEFIAKRRLNEYAPDTFRRLYGGVWERRNPSPAHVQEKLRCQICIMWEGCIVCRVH